MNTNELFAAYIARCRFLAVLDATQYAVERGFPADVVQDAALRAGELWDRANPLVAPGYVGGQL